MKKLTILLAILLVLGTSCKDFLSVNETNPNSASYVPANLVLPAALNSVAELYNQPDNFNFVYLWHGIWSVKNGYVQPTQLTQYNLLNSDYQGTWSNSYLALANFDYVEKNSTTSKDKYYRAIARIMKVYLFQNLVDCYGNIPYTQALQSDAGILKPEYDAQQTIYEDLVIKIDSAINLINTAPSDANAVTGDIIYSGNMTLWAKFANTIKLRMLINQSGMASRTSYITTALATTSSTGYIGVGEGAMLNPGYVQTTNKMNPFWENFYKVDNTLQADAMAYYGAGQDLCSFLTNNNDPRKLRIFQAYSGSAIQGNYFGAKVLQPVSSIGYGILKKYNQDAPILTDFESLFLQSEAAARSLTTGDAKALYESAVTQSILYLGEKSYWDPDTYAALTSSYATAYLAQDKDLVNYDKSPNKVRAIITQKWCALCGVSPLAIWTDFRRTGYPDFLTFSADVLRKSDTPPVRLLYPQTEINTNGANVDAQGDITLTGPKIFWQNR
jgi:hypothetical protein